jgi:hypothetical protein
VIRPNPSENSAPVQGRWARDRGRLLALLLPLAWSMYPPTILWPTAAHQVRSWPCYDRAEIAVPLLNRRYPSPGRSQGLGPRGGASADSIISLSGDAPLARARRVFMLPDARSPPIPAHATTLGSLRHLPP